jgi:hypothetical protein
MECLGWMMRETMRKIILALVFLFIAVPSKAQNNIYIAQNATGLDNGSTCANAFGYTFFNTSSNWSGSVQSPSNLAVIGPGTTVHLCGTLTGEVGINGILIAQGAGTSANPITLKFEPGAILQSPQMQVGIYPTAYFIIDGGTTCGYINGPGNASVPCNGTIQNTASGTAYPSNTNQSDAIWDSNGNIEVRNLNIINMYVRTSSTDFNAKNGPPHPTAIYFANSAPNVNFHNNIVHDVLWAINGDADNVTVAHNEIYNVDHMIFMGTASVTHTGLNIHDNWHHDPAPAWDSTGSSHPYHHDMVHLESTGANNFVVFYGGAIYNNYCSGDWGTDNTGCFSIWANNGTAIFNNLAATSSGNQNDGAFSNSFSDVNLAVVNNTAIGASTSIQTTGIFNAGGTTPTVENNVVSTAAVMGGTNEPCGTTYTWKFNVYGNFSSNQPFVNGCSGSGVFLAFPNWQTFIGGDSHSTFLPTSTLNLNSLGVPQTGSPAIGAGTNLSSLCTANGGTLPNALCSDILGHPRPGVGGGAWDAGAYSSGTASGNQPPPAPSGLTVTVNN